MRRGAGCATSQVRLALWQVWQCPAARLRAIVEALIPEDRSCASLNIVVALACACLLIVAPSRAESPSPETLAAARELVATIKATDNFKAILPTMMQTMKPAIVQGRPAVEKDYDAIVPRMIELATSRLSERGGAHCAGLCPKLHRRTSCTNSGLLSHADRTKAGAEYAGHHPAEHGDRTTMGQGLAADLRARITDELRKRGHDI